MKKNNIRSIRFSDDVAELIEQQIGDTFTQKFENLITKCAWELPKKERELARIQEQIDREGRRLRELAEDVYQFRNTISNLDREAKYLEKLLQSNIEKLERNTTRSAGEEGS